MRSTAHGVVARRRTTGRAWRAGRVRDGHTRPTALLRTGVLADEFGLREPTQLRSKPRRVAPKAAHVTWMLARYQPAPGDAGRLVELADLAAPRAQPAVHGVQSREYLARERRATQMWMVYNEIPGSLQTYEFAFATLSKSPLVDDVDVDALARDRADRGERIFRPDGPEVWVVLGEAALDRMDGGPDVCAREVERLVAVSECLAHDRARYDLSTAVPPGGTWSSESQRCPVSSSVPDAARRTSVSVWLRTNR